VVTTAALCRLEFQTSKDKKKEEASTPAWQKTCGKIEFPKTITFELWTANTRRKHLFSHMTDFSEFFFVENPRRPCLF
jgi:hypothetical protein